MLTSLVEEEQISKKEGFVIAKYNGYLSKTDCLENNIESLYKY